jgi:hypothetical protein
MIAACIERPTTTSRVVEPRTGKLQTYVTEAELVRLDAYAHRHGVSRSMAARALLLHALHALHAHADDEPLAPGEGT